MTLTRKFHPKSEFFCNPESARNLENVMIKFYDEFIELEQLGFLDRTNNNDLWVLHKVYLPVINQKLLEMKTYYNDHPIRSARAKSPNQMYAENALRSQVINTSISLETIDILHN